MSERHIYDDGCGPLEVSSHRDIVILLKWIVGVQIARKTSTTETLCRACLADSLVEVASILLDEHEG